ncbi:MAG: hypothetical protein RLZZ350_280 [Verrucomicrobiota bacterium]|jgi:glycosyltransferase involved in cell wall biosynthesis
MTTPLTVAWISYFPVEWLPDAPDEIRSLPREHPTTWQRVLLGELALQPGLKLHIIVLRKHFVRNLMFERNGVTFHLLKTVGGLRAASFFWHDTFLIRRRLADIKPTVIHAWGAERGAALIASRLGYPYVATVQGLLTWYEQVAPLNRYHKFAAWLERRSYPRAPVVTTESSFAVNFLKQRWPQMNVRQVEHAPDWKFHQLTRTPQLSPRRFLYVGVCSQIKGSDVLVRALDQLRGELDFELTVVGSASETYLTELRGQVSAELWARIQFKQDLTPELVAEEMAQAALMIFPTRADTSPNAVKEAVVAGLPVVASAVGGIPDYVWPGRNGILFQPGKVADCARAVREACGHELFGHGVVAAEALAAARDYLSPRRMGDGFGTIYSELGSGCAAI